METITVHMQIEDKGGRLDKALSMHAPQFSRARLQALINAGHLSMAGSAVMDCSLRLKGDEIFVLAVPPAEDATPKAQKIDLDIVYEDDDLLVINKSADMVVHPAAGNHDGTLVNALLAHCGDTLSGIGGVRRPGIVHRLDKETSGLMAVAKNDAAHKGLSLQLSGRTLTRVYHALVWGDVTPPKGRIETQIGRHKTNRKKMAVLEGGGREAITDYQRLQNFGMVASLVECRLKTGRTHQIRVHMAHIGHWLVGDPTYSKPSTGKFLRLHKVDAAVGACLTDFKRQALHAAQLEFIHPISKNKMSFKADLPQDMAELLATLKAGFPKGGNK